MQGEHSHAAQQGQRGRHGPRTLQSAPGVFLGMHLQRSRLSSFISLQMWSRSTLFCPRIMRWKADTAGSVYCFSALRGWRAVGCCCQCWPGWSRRMRWRM